MGVVISMLLDKVYSDEKIKAKNMISTRYWNSYKKISSFKSFSYNHGVGKLGNGM